MVKDVAEMADFIPAFYLQYQGENHRAVGRVNEPGKLLFTLRHRHRMAITKMAATVLTQNFPGVHLDYFHRKGPDCYVPSDMHVYFP